MNERLNFILPVSWCRGCFDVGEDEDNAITPDWKDASQMSSGHQHLTKASSIGSMAHTTKEEDSAAQNSSLPRYLISEQKKYSSGSLIPESTFSPKRISMEADRLASPKLNLTCVIWLWSSLLLSNVKGHLTYFCIGSFNCVDIRASGATVDHCIVPREILVINLPSAHYKCTYACIVFNLNTIYAVDEMSDSPHVEHKGRFKVTSADLSPKV